jgi:hypothetical protein
LVAAAVVRCDCGRTGYIDIYYLKDFIQFDEGPSLKKNATSSSIWPAPSRVPQQHIGQGTAEKVEERRTRTTARQTD